MELRNTEFDNKNLKSLEYLEPHADFTYATDKKVNFVYVFRKAAFYFLIYTIATVSINVIWYIFQDRLLFPIDYAVFLFVFLLILNVLSGRENCPAYYISINNKDKSLVLRYTCLFFINRIHKANFDMLKIKVKKDKLDSISKVVFFTKSMSEICHIDKSEGLFTKEKFKELTEKIDRLTVFKNR